MKISSSAPVLLLTPTRDAPVCFALCEHWMSRQTYAGPVQWLVVDDGDFDQTVTMGQRLIKRKRQGLEPAHTLPCNLLTAIPHIEAEIVLIIENDDYYPPQYVEKMVAALSDPGTKAYGNSYHRKYNVRNKHWWKNSNTKHASLCCTGLRGVALPMLKLAAEMMTPFVDMHFWTLMEGMSRMIPSDEPSSPGCIGIKCLPAYRPLTTMNGRMYHNRTKGGGKPDHDLRVAWEWMGSDFGKYLELYP